MTISPPLPPHFGGVVFYAQRYGNGDLMTLHADIVDIGCQASEASGIKENIGEEEVVPGRGMGQYKSNQDVYGVEEVTEACFSRDTGFAQKPATAVIQKLIGQILDRWLPDGREKEKILGAITLARLIHPKTRYGKLFTLSIPIEPIRS